MSYGALRKFYLYMAQRQGEIKQQKPIIFFSFWFDQAAVQQLYEFRDHYFEHNSIEKAPLKKKETEQKLKETLNILDHVQGKDKSF